MLIILRETPVWVYAVFFLLLYYGVMACFRSNETRRSLLISPVIFLIWSLAAMNYTAQPLVSIGSWAVGLLAGLAVAFLGFSYQGITKGAEHHSSSVPGSSKLLMISMLFFCIKYYIGYQQATDPVFANSLPILILTGVASGLTIGLLCGRAWKMLSILSALSRDSDRAPVCVAKK